MELLVDIQEKRLRRSLYDDHDALLPDFIVSEKVPLSVGLISRTRRPWDSRIFTPIDPTDYTIRAALGSFREPVGGTFEVIYEGDPSPVLVPAADTTAAQLDLAMNAVPAIVTAGGLVVTGSDGFFVISFNEPGARSIWMADATQAIPSLLLLFTILVDGDVDDRAVQTLRIEQNIASLADLETNSNPPAEAVTVVASTDLFTTVAHGLTAGRRIQFTTTGTLPVGLALNTDYFVIASGLTADDFKVSATEGGSSVAITDPVNLGTHYWTFAVLTVLTAGDGSHSQKNKITLPANRWGGEWTLSVASQPSDLIGWDDSEQQIQAAIEAITGVGAGNVSVRQDSDDSFIVLFKGALQNTAIAMTVDISTLKILQTKSGSLDLQNAQVEFLLDGPDARVVTLELEVTNAAGDTDKIQVDVMLRRPVVKLDSVIAPFPASNYYTRDQIDALLAGLTVGSVGNHRLQEFSATTAQTVYTLTDIPIGTPIVFVRGLLKAEDDFSVVSNVVTFDSGADIVAGDEVLIFYFY